MLTAAEQAAMAAEQALTLQTPCHIGRRVLTPDDMGGQTETISLTDSMCRIAPSNNMPDYQMFAGRAQDTQLWRITFAAGTDVRVDDRVLAQNRTFEVVGVLAPATFETARQTICIEVRGG